MLLAALSGRLSGAAGVRRARAGRHSRIDGGWISGVGYRLAEGQTEQPTDRERIDVGPTCPVWQPSERDAIPQPPKPLIEPALRVVECDIDFEAAR